MYSNASSVNAVQSIMNPLFVLVKETVPVSTTTTITTITTTTTMTTTQGTISTGTTGGDLPDSSSSENKKHAHDSLLLPYWGILNSIPLKITPFTSPPPLHTLFQSYFSVHK